MMQLVVPVVRSVKCQTLLDTGCSFTLMQDHLWRCICKPNETLKPCADHTFVLADGRIKHAMGWVQLVFTLADKMWTLKTFVMTKAQLAFPLVLRIDFLARTGIVIDVKNLIYGMQDKERMVYNPFHQAGDCDEQGQDHCQGALDLYLARPTAVEKLPNSSVDIDMVAQKADVSVVRKEQLHSLLCWWSAVCVDTGCTHILKHQINQNVLLVRKRVYRASPQKQQFIKDQIEEMLPNNLIRPSQSAWAAPVALVALIFVPALICFTYPVGDKCVLQERINCVTFSSTRSGKLQFPADFVLVSYPLERL